MCRRHGSLAQSEAGIGDSVAMVDQWEAEKPASSQPGHRTSLVSPGAVRPARDGQQSFYETEPGHSLLVTIATGEIVISSQEQTIV